MMTPTPPGVKVNLFLREKRNKDEQRNKKTPIKVKHKVDSMKCTSVSDKET